MRVIFVRHAESTANVGLPSEDHVQIPLTKQGHFQAQQLASAWKGKPSAIFLSPFLRTQLTAAPTIAIFPTVPVGVLPMEEFTYLEPGKWKGSTQADRKPHAEAYWAANDPEARTGEGAESFGALMGRVRRVLDRLETFLGDPNFDDPKISILSPQGDILCFSHGQFMLAVKTMMAHSQRSLAEQMGLFRKMRPFENCEMFAITLDEGYWRRWYPGDTIPDEDPLRKALLRRALDGMPKTTVIPLSSVSMPAPKAHGFELAHHLARTKLSDWDQASEKYLQSQREKRAEQERILNKSTEASSSPMFCEHANESPAQCTCPPNCYCKLNSCRFR